MVRSAVFVILGCLAMVPGASTAGAAQTPRPTVSYNRDVRPILSDKCFRCHGPDSAARQADLRLDDPQSATARREGRASVVPGDPARSELVSRITTDDADLRMPPVDSELTLSDEEREILRRWIAQGAKYEPHWAFIAPVRPPLPRPRDTSGVKNPIDLFVRARLDEENLAPAPEADPVTLCRRLYLDLTGIPPTPEEVDAFVRSYSPSLRPSGPPSRVSRSGTKRSEDGENAYEDLVDSLLASPRFGERMAGPWLDAARYADTNGYQSDGPRTMWRWRDWVIEAYNKNLPYDRFTVEQLAGDLLPEPSLDQLIATGFNRNHRINAEGGIIPAEFLVEYVADRAETTATVWLGLTLGCARCHDHKYDPISQRDYYRLFAYFNLVPEPGKGVRDDNSPPLVRAPTREQAAELRELESKFAAADRAWRAKLEELPAALAAWAPKATRNTSLWTIDEGLKARYRFDGSLDDDFDATTKVAAAQSPRYAGGPFGEALECDGEQTVSVAKTIPFESEKPFSASVWVKPAAGVKSQAVYSAVDTEANDGGVELRLVDGRPEVIISNRLLDDAIRVEAKIALPPNEWSHVAWTYGGVKFADEVRLYIDGRPVETETKLDLLSNKFKATAELKIGGGVIGGPFTGRIADLRFYDRALSADETAIVYCGLSIRALAGQYPNFGDPASELKFREYFLRHEGREQFGPVRDALAAAERNLDAFVETLPTTMVMRDEPGLRTTHVLNRGEYDKPGAAVTPGIPASLPQLAGTAAEGSHADRLALARWIVDPRNPLTSRVAVNRLWQLFFGTGLVKTSEDFGAQGESPVHPELLDWLAVEFAQGSDPSADGPKTAPWDVKAMIRLVVTSATYRQSSRTTPALAARDPENRLLARGARFRLPAEAVRDSALAASGLLKERIGGPSVMPYQPEGLWEELSATSTKYVLSQGDDLYRRSLYTFRKRTIGPPSMMIFDGAGREMCVVRSARTNTPLQALNLLNDTAYVEAAASLAGLMMRDGGSTPLERISYGFRRVLGRRPDADELRVLAAGYERRLAEFRADPKAARALLAHGASGAARGKHAESSREGAGDATIERAAYATVEPAAYATVANVLLNLDEFVTRE